MPAPLVRYTTEQVFARHQGGKIEVCSRVPCASPLDLTLAYTPGVADACRAIAADPAKARDYTTLDNMVAVLTNGTAILGLGDIGPLAGHPVMEGKCLLFKLLAGVDAFPLSIQEKDTEKLIDIIKAVSVSFGGLNLEDIAAPACFTVEQRLDAETDLPVFHDDQHGTAVVVLAALLNALRIVGKGLGELKIVISGAGAAAIATAKLLHAAGARHLVLCDTRGAIYPGRVAGMNPYKDDIAPWNRDNCRGSLADALAGADVFLGLSVAKQCGTAELQRMRRDAIVFAMANPVPEVMPEEAQAAGVRIIASGRSDYANQINNVLGFPGIFRGALSVRARQVTLNMKLAAARAIAAQIGDDGLREDNIIVSPLHDGVFPAVAAAVADAAAADGVARRPRTGADVAAETRARVAAARARQPYAAGA
ncbi:MAG TPA: malic enzyme-like NAD(P)-binding protein [bacterium]|nr:malic enzyme-like NAD(P)-binding protein [bacterium]